MIAIQEKPLTCEITHLYDGVQISDRELNRLLAIAGWDGHIPTFKTPGRVAWEPIREKVVLKSNPDYRFLIAKMKGVGGYNPPDKSEYNEGISGNNGYAPFKPTMDEFRPELPYEHIGFTDNGDYKFAYSKPAPLGGILHERAVREFNIGKAMMKAGIPSIVPLAVIKYDNSFQFEGKSMGAVIMLSVSESVFRISEALTGSPISHPGKNPEADNYYDNLRQSLGIPGNPEEESVRIATIQCLAEKVGRLLRQFSETGMYRYSSSWNNFQYSKETGELQFIDLDSSRFMAEDQLSNLRCAQEALRDLSTGFYRILERFTYPLVLEEYTLRQVRRQDPVLKLLTAYFHDVDQTELKCIVEKLYRFFIPYWFIFKKYSRPMQENWSIARTESYKMDRDFFYVLSITLLFPVFQASALGKRYPVNIGQDELLEKARRFLGNRYEYFLHILNNRLVST